MLKIFRIRQWNKFCKAIDFYFYSRFLSFLAWFRSFTLVIKNHQNFVVWCSIFNGRHVNYVRLFLKAIWFREEFFDKCSGIPGKLWFEIFGNIVWRIHEKIWLSFNAFFFLGLSQSLRTFWNCLGYMDFQVPIGIIFWSN